MSHVTELAQLARDFVSLAMEPDPDLIRQVVRELVAEDSLKTLVREVLAESSIDTCPYYYSTESAAAATGLSRNRIHELIREEVLSVRQDGTKLLIVGTSLRRYLDSLPPRGTR